MRFSSPIPNHHLYLPVFKSCLLVQSYHQEIVHPGILRGCALSALATWREMSTLEFGWNHARSWWTPDSSCTRGRGSESCWGWNRGLIDVDPAIAPSWWCLIFCKTSRGGVRHCPWWYPQNVGLDASNVIAEWNPARVRCSCMSSFGFFLCPGKVSKDFFYRLRRHACGCTVLIRIPDYWAYLMICILICIIISVSFSKLDNLPFTFCSSFWERWSLPTSLSTLGSFSAMFFTVSKVISTEDAFDREAVTGLISVFESITFKRKQFVGSSSLNL